MEKSIFDQILKRAKPLLKKGRIYDLDHTIYSLGFMKEILNGEGKRNREKVLIPAIILHDIGWSEVDDKKNTDWSKTELRIKHMKIGEKLAEEILKEISYPNDLIGEIKKLVGNHDNFYLGKEPKSEDEKILRDADGCFSFTSLSFWKDYKVEFKKGKKYNSPEEFLKKLEKNVGKKYTKSGTKIFKKLKNELVKEIRLKENGKIL